MTGQQTSLLNSNLPPLAERVRPAHLAEFIGQGHLLGDNSLLSRAIRNETPFSLIFWGPPGSGKTTLAKLMARAFKAQYFEISAVSAGVKLVREILEKGKNALLGGRRTLLFIDEIHRFSKSQQDALLHGVENGTLILIGATTENPSFEIIPPLLSRCKVMTLDAYSLTELQTILRRAIEKDLLLSRLKVVLSEKVETLLLNTCGGDVRKMLNTLELAISLHASGEIPVKLSENDIREALQSKTAIYDKAGDYHYDTISAFIKSVRGSDPDAAIYWLATMLIGGEKPEFIARRLIILASEDIGNADPYALVLTNACMQAVHAVGPPESDIVLAQVTTYLASAPKSNAAHSALRKAINYIREKGSGAVPLQLRNAPTNLMKSLGHGKDYQYPHAHKDHFVNESYFPDEVENPPSFYNPTDQGREKFLKERLSALWKDRYR
ncbi:MAG: replication-associated recombination protein A [FCB group bacterium]|nr:replication-associated recombination protein A [FCB group bacterium]